MLFRTSASLVLLLCMSLSCFPDQLSGNKTNICHVIDDVYEVLRLYLVDIDAQDAKHLCDDIIASIDEFSSINVVADVRTNSLILTGPAYEVHLLEYNFRQRKLAFRDSEHKLLVLDLTYIDAQDAKNICSNIITSTDEFSSVSISVVSPSNSLIISGIAYEVERIVKHIDDSEQGLQ